MDRISIMKECEPSKLTMAVAMIDRVRVAEESSTVDCIIGNKSKEDIIPNTRLAIDDFIFYMNMMGYTLDDITDEDYKKVSNKFIECLKSKMNEIHDLTHSALI